MVQPELGPNVKTSKINIPREWRHSESFPNDFITGNPNDQIQTRSSLKKQASVTFISHFEPKKIDEALKDESWVLFMKEELE